MHPSAAVASLLLSLFASPVAAESAPAPAPPASVGDFFDSLQAPITLENLRADAEDGYLEISYDLRGVGAVSVAVYSEDEDSGRGHVTVGEAVMVEVGFVDGALAWEWADFAGLGATQAHDVAASVVQVWQEDMLTDALGAASRDGKCDVAGKIAGASTATLVGAGACC